MTEPNAPPAIADSFHTLILQPTTLCNLNCAYCYLPDRTRQRLMPPPVAQACAASVVDQASPYRVDVVWHGGEPTATPIRHFRTLLEPFEALRQSGAIRHGIQTNATLINDAWCELFVEYGFHVGVSIDGPAAANAHRLDRAGHQTWHRTMRGIRRLRAAGIPFTVICVVTPQTIGQPDELADFFTDLGCESVGFNIEEQEGTDRPPVDEHAAYLFWRRLIQRRAGGSALRVRELDRLADYLNMARHGGLHPAPFDPIPTVAYNGQTVLLSPELLGVQDPSYGDFIAGNVLTRPLTQTVKRMGELRYVAEFADGLVRCVATCDFFGFCRGAQAANRYFEHGTLAATETTYCRTTKQALVRAAVDELVGEEVNV